MSEKDYFDQFETDAPEQEDDALLGSDAELENMSVDELIASVESDLAPTEAPDAAWQEAGDLLDAAEEDDFLDPVAEGEDTLFGDGQEEASVSGMLPLEVPSGDMDNTIVAPNGGFSQERSDDAPPPVQPQEPVDPDNFEPDFGTAFDDYGDYSDDEEAEEPDELQAAEQEETPRRKKRKKKRTPILVRLILYAAMVTLLGCGMGMFAWECAQDVLALGHENHTITVTVGKNDTIDDVTNTLYTKGLIRHKWLFGIYCDLTHAEEKIDPGTYELNSLYDYHALVNGMIETAGTRATVTVMIAEGYDTEQLFALLEENGVCDADELRTAAANAEFDYWFLEGIEKGTASRLEGFLYPDTYDFYVGDDPENVLKKMLNNFERKIDDKLKAQIEASGYSVREVITIASIIEEEAANDDERADISSVIHNRLATDDYLRYLQMDSTVFYACQLLGENFDLTIDSPYNTYVYSGLPAGPIDNPGMRSIVAALEPSETNYYYFAAGVDGVSHFFSDFDSHQAFITSPEFSGNDEEP